MRASRTPRADGDRQGDADKSLLVDYAIRFNHSGHCYDPADYGFADESVKEGLVDLKEFQRRQREWLLWYWVHVEVLPLGLMQLDQRITFHQELVKLLAGAYVIARQENDTETADLIEKEGKSILGEIQLMELVKKFVEKQQL